MYKGIGSRYRVRTPVHVLECSLSLRDMLNRQRGGQSKARRKLKVRFLISQMVGPMELICDLLAFWIGLNIRQGISCELFLEIRCLLFLWYVVTWLRPSGAHKACGSDNQAIPLGTWKFRTSSIFRISIVRKSLYTSTTYSPGE